MSKFGNLLRDLREATGASMGTLAKAIGVSVAYLSDVELSRRPPLTAQRIDAAAAALGLGPERTTQLHESAAESRTSFNFAPQRPEEAKLLGALARRLPTLDQSEMIRIREILETDT